MLMLSQWIRHNLAKLESIGDGVEMDQGSRSLWNLTREYL
jgi:hypothetical protein